MKRIIFIVFILFSTIANSQKFDVGIVTGPMTTAQINSISNPQEGRQVYNSTKKTIWYYNGSLWIDSGVSTGGSGDMLKSENLSGLANTAIARTNIGIGNIDDTSDLNKPISTATQTALNGKLNLTGGTLTGPLNMGSNQLSVGAILANNNIETTGAIIASSLRTEPAATSGYQPGKIYTDSDDSKTYLGVSGAWHEILTDNSTVISDVQTLSTITSEPIDFIGDVTGSGNIGGQIQLDIANNIITPNKLKSNNTPNDENVPLFDTTNNAVEWITRPITFHPNSTAQLKYITLETKAAIAAAGYDSNTVLAIPTDETNLLDDISDVVITTPATGGTLRYNGTNWVNLPKGAANSVLAVNSGGTDIAYKIALPAATTPTTVLDLSNVGGNLANMGSANTSATFTTTGAVLGGWVKVLINRATAPTVTGATLINGATFVANTNMYMVVAYNGVNTQYYFLKI